MSKERTKQLRKLLQKSNSAGLELFVRERLKLTPEEAPDKSNEERMRCHHRINMSGYEESVGECTKTNTGILMKFADCGIFDHVDSLFINAYKGGVTVISVNCGGEAISKSYGGYGTIAIIMDILREYSLKYPTEGRRRD